MRAAARAVCVALALSGAAGETCPSTGAGVTTHASCQLGVQFSQACSQVRSEITSRLLAFRAGHWVDPHNGGTYNLTSSASATMLQASRVTGAHCPGCYTDKMDFTLTATEDEGCELLACSVSQSSSMCAILPHAPLRHHRPPRPTEHSGEAWDGYSGLAAAT